MALFSLVGLTPCADGDVVNSFYCVLGSRDDCCDTGVGRIRIPSWDLFKRQEYASMSGSLVSGNDYYTTTLETAEIIVGSNGYTSLTSAIIESVIGGNDYYSTTRATATSLETVFRTTETVPEMISSPTPDLSHLPSSPTSSDAIAASSMYGPGEPPTNTNTASAQEPPTSIGLSTGTKAGIGVGVSIVTLLIVGLGVAALVFYRRLNQPRDQTNEGTSMLKISLNNFATDRTIPEMDAASTERPVELESSGRAELAGSEVSGDASHRSGSRRVIGAVRNSVHEM